jgi:hypothetical protein
MCLPPAFHPMGCRDQMGNRRQHLDTKIVQFARSRIVKSVAQELRSARAPNHTAVVVITQTTVRYSEFRPFCSVSLALGALLFGFVVVVSFCCCHYPTDWQDRKKGETLASARLQLSLRQQQQLLQHSSFTNTASTVYFP